MPAPDVRPLILRLWIYQAERFPVFKHGLLIAAFAASGVSVSALLAGRAQVPSPAAFGVAFAVLFGLFLLLRIADEFKDAVTDARYRPERPVPRGLVNLRELAWLGWGVAGAQVLLVTVHAPGLLFLLVLVWAYMALMSQEFYCADWLRTQPMAYMLSHMLVMPLIDLFATACDWWPAHGAPPHGLTSFLALSFCNGLIIELGRKTWAPVQERVGVESYSSAWGLPVALTTWLAALFCALLLALETANRIAFVPPVAGVLGILAISMGYTAMRLARTSTPVAAQRLEAVSGVWVLASYMCLGPLPLGVRMWGGQ